VILQICRTRTRGSRESRPLFLYRGKAFPRSPYRHVTSLSFFIGALFSPVFCRVVRTRRPLLLQIHESVALVLFSDNVRPTFAGVLFCWSSRLCIRPLFAFPSLLGPPLVLFSLISAVRVLPLCLLPPIWPLGFLSGIPPFAIAPCDRSLTLPFFPHC